MKIDGYFIPFVVALAVSGLGFYLLDMVLMNMQGLSLMYSK